MRALHRRRGEGRKDRALRGEGRQEREVQEGRGYGGANERGGLASFRGTEAREGTIATAEAG